MVILKEKNKTQINFYEDFRTSKDYPVFSIKCNFDEDGIIVSTSFEWQNYNCFTDQDKQVMLKFNNIFSKYYIGKDYDKSFFPLHLKGKLTSDLINQFEVKELLKI
jgi:hypothetical protein